MVEIIICSLELKDHIVFSKEPEAFCGVGKVAQTSVYFSFAKKLIFIVLSIPW